uniref:Putative secreted protein n=1 Tax=Ixodes ricinus TaxID=34613 RepID=A0A6B0UQ05_IXORI
MSGSLLLSHRCCCLFCTKLISLSLSLSVPILQGVPPKNSQGFSLRKNKAVLRRTLVLCPGVALAFRARCRGFQHWLLFYSKIIRGFLEFLMGKWRPTELFDTWSSMLLKTGKNGAHFPIEFFKKIT